MKNIIIGVLSIIALLAVSMQASAEVVDKKNSIHNKGEQFLEVLQASNTTENNWVYNSENKTIVFTATEENTIASCPEELKKNVEKVVLNDGITAIRTCGFARCENLVNIEIPDSVTEIGAGAFEECKKLNNVKLPKDIKYIKGSTFWRCESLTDIKIPYGVTYILDGAFDECISLNRIEIPNSVKILNGFGKCTSLTNIEIPNSVIQIGGFGESGLSSVELPSSIKIIDDWAFYGCNKLTNIIIPESVEEIRERAFSGCSEIKYFVIPKSVKKIGRLAFYGQYQYVVFLGDNVEIYDENFLVADNTIIYGYKGSTAEKYARKYNKQFAVYDGKTVPSIKPIQTATKMPVESSKISLKKVKAPVVKIDKTKKVAEVKISKIKGATGYVVQYGTNSDFKNAKTIKISNSKSKVKLKKIKSKKKYYVRYRAYEKFNGTTSYSKWSNVKTIKL